MKPQLSVKSNIYNRIRIPTNYVELVFGVHPSNFERLKHSVWFRFLVKCFDPGDLLQRLMIEWKIGMKNGNPL